MYNTWFDSNFIGISALSYSVVYSDVAHTTLWSVKRYSALVTELGVLSSSFQKHAPLFVESTSLLFLRNTRCVDSRCMRERSVRCRKSKSALSRFCSKVVSLYKKVFTRTNLVKFRRQFPPVPFIFSKTMYSSVGHTDCYVHPTMLRELVFTFSFAC